MKRRKQPSGTRFASVYSAFANGKKVLDVLVETPDWLPFAPRINPEFVRPLADRAIRREMAA